MLLIHADQFYPSGDTQAIRQARVDDFSGEVGNRYLRRCGLVGPIDQWHRDAVTFERIERQSESGLAREAGNFLRRALIRIHRLQFAPGRHAP